MENVQKYFKTLPTFINGIMFFMVSKKIAIDLKVQIFAVRQIGFYSNFQFHTTQL